MIQPSLLCDSERLESELLFTVMSECFALKDVRGMDAEAESPWMDLRRAVEGDTSYSTISIISATALWINQS